MHTRSKRYLRRHRARMRAAQARSPSKPISSLRYENRFALQIAAGMKKRWPEIVPNPPESTLYLSPRSD
jgi:hypothetical protein